MTANTTDASRIAELEADNHRLRRLLDQRDAPGELRHRLRSTLGLLRSIIRRSADTPRELPDYVGHLEDRLDALARAQAAADERGSVNLHQLLADELLHYGASEGERLALAGPDVELRPRAGQVLALAVHELAVNAVEHGVLGEDAGRIDVAWQVEPAKADPELLLVWKESGLVEPPEPARSGFGTEALARMLPYELKADTSLVRESDGFRCTIRLLLTKSVGDVGPG